MRIKPVFEGGQNLITASCKKRNASVYQASVLLIDKIMMKFGEEGK